MWTKWRILICSFSVMYITLIMYCKLFLSLLSIFQHSDQYFKFANYIMSYIVLWLYHFLYYIVLWGTSMDSGISLHLPWSVLSHSFPPYYHSSVFLQKTALNPSLCHLNWSQHCRYGQWQTCIMLLSRYT